MLDEFHSGVSLKTKWIWMVQKYRNWSKEKFRNVKSDILIWCNSMLQG